jgi:cell shape-determining protein MreC
LWTHSEVSLICVLALYTLLGALVFIAFEAPNAIQTTMLDHVAYLNSIANAPKRWVKFVKNRHKIFF